MQQYAFFRQAGRWFRRTRRDKARKVTPRITQTPGYRSFVRNTLRKRNRIDTAINKAIRRANRVRVRL